MSATDTVDVTAHRIKPITDERIAQEESYFALLAEEGTYMDRETERKLARRIFQMCVARIAADDWKMAMLELEAERLRSVVRIAREVDVHLAGHLRSPESDEGRLHAALVALDETEGRDRKIPTASAP